MCLKLFFMGSLFLSLAQIGNAESSLWSSFATTVTVFGKKLVDIVAPPYFEAVTIMQSPLTKALCDRNTVRITNICE